MTDLWKTVLESVPATAVIICVILFLKYIQSRDKKDIQQQENCEKTISNMVEKHDIRTSDFQDQMKESQKEFQQTIRQMDSTVRKVVDKT